MWPVQVDAAVLEVTGDEGDGLGVIAVSEGDTGIGGAAGGSGDARDDLEGDTLRGQGIDLLAAASKDEGIAALEAQDPLALLGQVGQQAVDVLLTHDVMVTFLTHVDAPGIPARQVEDRLGHQAVVDHHVGLLHEPQGAEGDQVRIARPGTYQVNLPHARPGAGGGQFAGHGGIGLRQLTGKDPLRDPPDQDPVPEMAPVALVAEAGLDGVPIAGAEVGQAPVAGGDQGLQAGAQQARQHRRGLGGGDGHHHGRTVDDGGQDKAAFLRLIDHIDRNPGRLGQFGDATVDGTLPGGGNDQAHPLEVPIPEGACVVDKVPGQRQGLEVRT